MYATLLDDPDMINRQLGRYLAVGAADIQAAAAEVLRPDNRVVLTYVPAAEHGRRPRDEETRGMTLEEILSVRPSPGQPRDVRVPAVRADGPAVGPAGPDRRPARPAARLGQPARSGAARPTSRRTWPAPPSWRHGR